MRIAIAGGGIAGLVAALELHRRGHTVTVYEAVPVLKPLGVGINLLPHAVDILGSLGLLDALLQHGVATRELIYFNKQGQRIWAEPRGRFAGFDSPQISLSRGALHFTLLAAVLDALGADRVVTGHRFHQVIETGSGVIAEFKTAAGGGVAVEADLLIAADGIHSRARHQLFPTEGPPAYSGRVLWRATSLAKPFLSGASMIMAGHQSQKFVAYPIEPVRADGLQRINWIAELTVDVLLRREDWNRAANPADFAPRFADWRFGWLDVPGLVAAAEAIYEYPMVDRDPLPRWSHGRVTLIGDAAHPMYPIGSNGASQAILDARVLAEALTGSANPVACLAAYDALRRPATSAIVLANRSNGPEQVMQLAEERAPEGFDDIESIIPYTELDAIARRYRQLTGMARTVTP